MKAKRPSPLSHIDQRLEKRRKAHSERGELVDHDDETRQRCAVASSRKKISAQVLCTGLAQHTLAMADLGFEATQRTGGQSIVEIGDHADGMWERSEAGEGGAAFEVHE